MNRCLLPTKLDAVSIPASATGNGYIADADFPDISHAARSAADRAMVGNRISFVSVPRSSVFAAN